MTMTDWHGLVDAYADWLRQGIQAEVIGGAVAITTPFLDRHNDHLQILVRETAKGFVLSDDGEIIRDLITGGVDVKSPRRRSAIEAAAAGFGIQTDGRSLFVEARSNNIGARAHALIQAMIAVNDLYVLARQRVASLFFEDVGKWLDENEVRYSMRVKMTGKSGYDQSIDFLIPRSKEQPERVLQTLTNPTKPFVMNSLFGIEDVRRLRTTPLDAFVVMNDRRHDISDEVLDAFVAYDVRSTLWSDRAELIPALAA